mmetsp:Transcript_121037/g.342454  ORF Transcript_121037/g.342454 Transcript_121037/m.342454 type:complete len:1000 (-) Transcript_121037:218-3217(-)
MSRALHHQGPPSVYLIEGTAGARDYTCKLEECETFPASPPAEERPLLGAPPAIVAEPDAPDDDRLRDADEMTNFVETLLERPEFSEGHLSRASLERCQRKLLDVIAGRPVGGGANEELIDVMIYKGRPLSSARMIHVAVWCSAQLGDARLVQRVLSHLTNAEVFEKAKYKGFLKDGWQSEVWLDVMHIAAGFGSVASMHAILQHVTKDILVCPFVVPTPNEGACVISSLATTCPIYSPLIPGNIGNTEECVNSYAIMHEYELSNPENRRTSKFFMPIHDATFAGHSDVILWLLRYRADAGTPNRDGVTPLHFLAMRGVAEGIESDNVIRQLVRSMLKAGASLRTRIPENHYRPELRGKLPLELAAADDSRFPDRMLALLVPSIANEGSSDHVHFFTDISFLSSLSTAATSEAVRSLVDLTSMNLDVLRSFRLEAQRSGRTDVMASIMYFAPEAAGSMLDMLVVEPEVADAVKHNIPKRTSLWGLWRHDTMKCTYKSDVHVGRNGLKTPSWNFNSNRVLDEQPEILWHQRWIPSSGAHDVRSDHMFNVSVQTVLVPNILDIDMFMALSRIPTKHDAVFSKLSVQGMVTCLWKNLVERVWFSTLVIYCIETAALVIWGKSAGNISIKDFFCWAIITAAGMREMFHVIWFYRGCIRKWLHHEDEKLRSLWKPTSSFVSYWTLSTLALACVQLLFANSVHRVLKDHELSANDAMFLGIGVLWKCASMMYMFRLSPGGMRIHAIGKSLLGGATKEMLIITVAVFASFCLVFLVLAKHRAIGWVLASSYRGFLFGDGDGFNNLGMDIDEGNFAANDNMLMTFCLLGSFFFNILCLNLIIAVYGNEYNKVVAETPNLFAQARAATCVHFLLSRDCLPWLGPACNACFKVGSALLLVAAGGLHHVGVRSQCISAFLLAVAEILLEASLIQCDWFSTEGAAVNGEDQFLWMCHRVDMDAADALLTKNQLQRQLENLRDYTEERFENVDAQVTDMSHKLDLILERIRRG